jgi:hypothetical protein
MLWRELFREGLSTDATTPKDEGKLCLKVLEGYQPLRTSGVNANRSRLKEETAPDSMQTRAEASSRVIDNDVASQASVVFTIAAAVMFKPPGLESCVMVSRIPFGQSPFSTAIMSIAIFPPVILANTAALNPTLAGR